MRADNRKLDHIKQELLRLQEIEQDLIKALSSVVLEDDEAKRGFLAMICNEIDGLKDATSQLD